MFGYHDFPNNKRVSCIITTSSNVGQKVITLKLYQNNKLTKTLKLNALTYTYDLNGENENQQFLFVGSYDDTKNKHCFKIIDLENLVEIYNVETYYSVYCNLIRTSNNSDEDIYLLKFIEGKIRNKDLSYNMDLYVQNNNFKSWTCKIVKYCKKILPQLFLKLHKEYNLVDNNIMKIIYNYMPKWCVIDISKTQTHEYKGLRSGLVVGNKEFEDELVYMTYDRIRRELINYNFSCTKKFINACSWTHIGQMILYSLGLKNRPSRQNIIITPFNHMLLESLSNTNN